MRGRAARAVTAAVVLAALLGGGVAGCTASAPSGSAPAASPSVISPGVSDPPPDPSAAHPSGDLVLTSGLPPDRTDTIAATARRALADVESWWGAGSVPRPLLLQLPADAAQFQEVTGVRSAEVPAVVMGTGDERRVVLHPDAVPRLTDAGLQAVLTHEVSHLAMDAGQAPWWLVEGMAEYTAHRASALDPVVIAGTGLDGVRSGVLPTEWPTPVPEDRWQGYTLAWLACHHLAQRHSERALMSTFTRIAAGEEPDVVFRDEFGVSQDEALEGYRQWLVELVSGTPR